jgi:hypothetical protein
MMVIDGLKTCSLCRRAQPVSAFHLNRASKDGIHPWCKSCKNSKNAGYYKRWTPEQRLRHRRRLLRHNHGVEMEFVESLYREQGGKCAICQQPGLMPFSASGEGKMAYEALNLDHDHTTGAIRGLLCFKCNTGIGKLGDSAEMLLRAADYLLKERGQ